MDESLSGQIVLELCDACRTYWLVAVHGHSDDEIQHTDIEDLERISDDEGSELMLTCAR